MLLGNRSVLNKSPLKFAGGSSTSVEVAALSNWQKSGHRRNRFYPADTTTSKKLYSLPEGTYVGLAWLLPQKAGAMSSINNTRITLGASGAMAGGITTTGLAEIIFTVPDMAGQLITSGSGTASFSITTNSPLLTASLNGSGTASFAITTNTPILGAIASMTGAASFSFYGSLTPYAIGQMVGSTVDNSVLTSDVIASAVWAKAIEAGFTAEQVLRILAAHAAGAATGLEGANPQFTGLDGATLRIDGAYSAGTRTIDALNGS